MLNPPSRFGEEGTDRNAQSKFKSKKKKIVNFVNHINLLNHGSLTLTGQPWFLPYNCEPSDKYLHIWRFSIPSDKDIFHPTTFFIHSDCNASAMESFCEYNSSKLASLLRFNISGQIHWFIASSSSSTQHELSMVLDLRQKWAILLAQSMFAAI